MLNGILVHFLGRFFLSYPFYLTYVGYGKIIDVTRSYIFTFTTDENKSECHVAIFSWLFFLCSLILMFNILKYISKAIIYSKI